MKTTSLLATLLLPFSASLGQNDPVELTESVIIEKINEVDVLTGKDLKAHPAEQGELFQIPDFLQTGRSSRARLEADDGTVTRVGSNTLFSFEGSDRTINLKRGSLLFHSPEGRGGGRVVTASATASVVGTTIIVAATANGGFKVLVLEGVAMITYPDNTVRMLKAGQMTFVQPPEAGSPGGGNGGKGPVMNFDLEALTEGSTLVNGFDTPLASLPKIDTEVAAQNKEIDDGGLRKTNTFILHSEGDEVIGLDLNDLNELTEVAQQAARAENLRDQNENLDPPGTNIVNPQESGNNSNSNPGNSPTNGGNSELDRLITAVGSTVTVTDTFPAANFFDWPGVTVPDGTLESQPTDDMAFGFIAGDLILPGSNPDITPITMFPEDQMALVTIVGYNSISVTGSVTFEGFTQESTFTLQSIGSLDIAPYTAVEVPGPVSSASSAFGGTVDTTFPTTTTTAGFGGTEDTTIPLPPNTATVEWRVASTESLSLDTVSILNNTPGGILQVESEEGDLTAQSSMFKSEQSVRLSSPGLITLNGNEIQADFIEISGGKSVIATGNIFTGNTLEIEAVEMLSMSQTNLAGLDIIRMSAATITLENINFPINASDIQLQSANGMLAPNPNTGAAVQLSYVNFINNVTLGGDPAQNFVSPSVGGSSTSIANNPITISAQSAQ